MHKILVVDDEQASAMFLALSLSHEGYDVRSCMDGFEAVETIKEFRPDLLITDWVLQNEIDGIAVAQQALSELPALRIIFISGLPSEELARELPDLGEVEIFEKPTDLDEVIAKVKEMLGH